MCWLQQPSSSKTQDNKYNKNTKYYKNYYKNRREGKCLSKD